MQESANPDILYDEDIIVIGNGPAAISAAVRARWVKGYSAMPCSVAMIGAGPLGGLLPWGGVILTGPAWAFKGEDLLNTLAADVHRFRIEMISGAVNSVRRQGECWVVEGNGFAPRRCLSVILASGFRVVGDEATFFQKGVFITFKGYEYFPVILNEAADYSAGAGLLIVGNQQTEKILPLLGGIVERAGALTFLLDSPTALTGTEQFPGRLIRGRLREVVRNSSARTGVNSWFSVRTIDDDGHSEPLICGAILLDYNAFEQFLCAPAVRGEAASENVLLGLERDDRGFVMVDRWMPTSVPGLFAAGDVTGRYSSTLMALGDGVCAGFSAYRWAFRAKFGAEPRLFAYRASEDVIYPNPTDLPPISLRSRPRLLGHEQEFHALLKKHGMSHLACSGLSAMLSGRVMLVNMAENVGCDIEDLRQLVRNACAARLMTVHIVSDLRGTSADRNLVKDFQTCEEPADGGDYVWASG